MVELHPRPPKKIHKEIIDECPSSNKTQSIQIVDYTGYPVLTFDADDYREYVQDMGLNERQEQELLEALWSIIVGFIDLGFGIETSAKSADGFVLPSDNQKKSNNTEKGGVV